MYVGRLFIDQVEFDTDPTLPVKDRQQLMEAYARDLFNQWKRGLLSKPLFFVEAQSHMNNFLYEEMSWDDIYETTPGIKQYLLKPTEIQEDATQETKGL